MSPYRSLEQAIKEKFFIESIILFPEVLGSNNKKKYIRASAYLTSKYNSFNSSFRDIFSSGGQKTLDIKGQRVVKVPKILFKIYSKAHAIEKEISKFNEEDLLYYWGLKYNKGPRLDTWKKLLNTSCKWSNQDFKAADVFDAGLK